MPGLIAEPAESCWIAQSVLAMSRHRDLGQGAGCWFYSQLFLFLSVRAKPDV